MRNLPILSFIAALWLVAPGCLLAANQEDVTMESSTLEDSCRREVVELHQFFQDWFKAEVPNDSISFARFEHLLAQDFEIIGPEGKLADRDTVLEGVRSGHGRDLESDFRIEVRNVRSRTVGEGMVVVTYEEHQITDAKVRAWLSSALFRLKEGMPNGVEWVHVQETYLPVTRSH